MLNSASLEIQDAKCIEYCNKNNFTIINNISEICSARKMSNQKKLLNIINNNTNINLIIFDVSRFSRNMEDGIKTYNLCKQKNINIHFIKDTIRSSNINHFNIFSLSLLNAQNESDAISYRVTESVKYRKSLGNYIGKPKFGYTLIRNSNNILKIARHPQEYNILLLILRLKYGSTYNEINNLYKDITNNMDANITCLSPITNRIILYGNYENRDIIHILNSNNIFNNNKQFNSLNIYNLCKINSYKYHKKTNYAVNKLIKKLYDGTCDNNEFESLFQDINRYKLTLPQIDIDNCYHRMNNILNLLNNNNINFCIWTQNMITDIIFVNNIEEDVVDSDGEEENNNPVVNNPLEVANRVEVDNYVVVDNHVGVDNHIEDNHIEDNHLEDNHLEVDNYDENNIVVGNYEEDESNYEVAAGDELVNNVIQIEFNQLEIGDDASKMNVCNNTPEIEIDNNEIKVVNGLQYNIIYRLKKSVTKSMRKLINK